MSENIVKPDAEELAKLTAVGREYYKKLSDFLYSLDKSGFRTSPAQYIAAERLLIELACADLLNFQTLRSYLAPLFSFSPDEQAAFYRHYDNWFKDISKTIEALPATAATEEEKKLAREIVQGKPDKETGITSFLTPLKTARWWTKPEIQAILLLIVTAVVLTSLFFIPQVNEFINPPAPAPVSTVPPPSITPDIQKTYPPVERFYFWLIMAAAAFPVLVWGVWLAWWRWWRRHLDDWRKENREHLKLKRPRVNKDGNQLFEASAFRRFAQDLRLHRRIPVQSLDPEATVHASVDRAGFFTPVYGVRRVTPEYLILIDRTGYLDQQAQLIDEWITRLKTAGVFVDRFYFDGDPRTCFPSAADQHRIVADSFSLAALAARYPDQRLLIFGQPEGFVEPLSSRPAKWLTTILETWKVRILLSTATAESYAEWVIRDEGLPVLRADEENLQLLLKEIREAEMRDDETHSPRAADLPSAVPQLYPTLLLNDEKQWLAETEPDEATIEKLKKELYEYLGETGYRLLAACAVYPETLWDLTFYLAHHLLKSDEREAGLALLVRLPWLRYGKIPDWLRSALLDSLPEREQKLLRQTIERLLISYIAHPEQGFSLDLDKHSNESPVSGFKQSLYDLGDRKFFYDLLKTEDETSILREDMFLGFLARRKLSVRLSHRLKNYLKEKKAQSKETYRYLLEAVEAVKNFLYVGGNPMNYLTNRSLLLTPLIISAFIGFTFFYVQPNIVAGISKLLPRSPKAFDKFSPPPGEPDPESTPEASPSPISTPVTLPTPVTGSPTPTRTVTLFDATPTPTVTETPTPEPNDTPDTSRCGANNLTAADGYAIGKIFAVNYSTNTNFELSNEYPIGPNYLGKPYSRDILPAIISDSEPLLRNHGLNPSAIRPCVTIFPANQCSGYNSKCVDVTLQDFTEPTAQPTVTLTPEVTVTPTPTPRPTESATPTPPVPTPTMELPTIVSISVTLRTGEQSKGRNDAAIITLGSGSAVLGKISAGAGINWNEGAMSEEKVIRLARPVTLQECRDLTITVSKTNPGNDWEVSFKVDARLSNGRDINLLGWTDDHNLAENNKSTPAVRKLSCPVVSGFCPGLFPIC